MKVQRHDHAHLGLDTIKTEERELKERQRERVWKKNTAELRVKQCVANARNELKQLKDRARERLGNEYKTDT